VINFKKSGTQSAPIKLLNAPGEFPVIDCIDYRKVHRVLIQNAAGYNNAIGWITIEGFEIRDCYDGLKIYNAHDTTIRRNWIHHNRNQGVHGNGTRVLFDRNMFNHNGRFAICVTTQSVCNKDHGLYMNGTAITVTNNLFYDNLASGIQLNGGSKSVYKPTAHARPEFAASANWVIANNTFAYQANAPGIIVWGSTCNNARIENNIFYENRVKGTSAQGIYFSATTCTGITIKNNLAFASGSGGQAFISSGGSYTQSGNIVNTLNPKFVNAPATLPASPNFALTSGSPAIDKGLILASTSSTKISYPGTTRPKGTTNDIGAYEYNGSSSSTLTAPTSLLPIN
jgi:hypothetical protein